MTRLLLAPMEGLLDFTLRDVLTRVGGIDRCVSEFIRVTGTLLPERVFLRIVPELLNGGRTPAGVPVRAQLLGSDPICLSENAARLATLGPAGIDLNFGCPAKIVNRHGGGATLLAEPERLHAIVAAVRRAVPRPMPVSAKMRLGVDDASRAVECAQALVDAGAEELVVHARTKADGYRPPAYWDRIHAIRAAVPVPVVANGEIWTVADARRCRAESGCDVLMLGRGMVADPGLALAIMRDEACSVPHGSALAHVVAASHVDDAGVASHGPGPGQLHDARPADSHEVAWAALHPHLQSFWGLVTAHIEPRHRAGRLKQWLNYLRRRHAEAEALYAELRTVNDPARVSARLGLA